MSHTARPNDLPDNFNVRAWNARGESWDDYIRVLERAYAQYLERRRQGVEGQPWASPPDPDAEMPVGQEVP